MKKIALSEEALASIRGKLLSVERLPTISTMFQKLVASIENEQSTARDLEKLVALDPVVASQILKVVNSPYYGFSNITTIARAIVLLGFEEVKNIALSASLMEVFNVKSNLGAFSVSEFWLHCMATAFIARHLARLADLPMPEEFFTMGLLHDIGKVVFLKQEPQVFKALLEIAEEEQLPLNEVETAHGFSHSLVGWYLLEKWNFPERIAVPVKEHHEPEKGDAYPIEKAVVNLADYLTILSKIGRSGNPAPVQPKPQVLSMLGIAPRDIKQLLKEMVTKGDLIREMGQRLLSER